MEEVVYGNGAANGLELKTFEADEALLKGGASLVIAHRQVDMEPWNVQPVIHLDMHVSHQPFLVPSLDMAIDSVVLDLDEPVHCRHCQCLTSTRAAAGYINRKPSPRTNFWK